MQAPLPRVNPIIQIQDKRYAVNDIIFVYMNINNINSIVANLCHERIVDGRKNNLDFFDKWDKREFIKTVINLNSIVNNQNELLIRSDKGITVVLNPRYLYSAIMTARGVFAYFHSHQGMDFIPLPTIEREWYQFFTKQILERKKALDFSNLSPPCCIAPLHIIMIIVNDKSFFWEIQSPCVASYKVDFSQKDYEGMTKWLFEFLHEEFIFGSVEDYKLAVNLRSIKTIDCLGADSVKINLNSGICIEMNCLNGTALEMQQRFFDILERNKIREVTPVSSTIDFTPAARSKRRPNPTPIVRSNSATPSLPTVAAEDSGFSLPAGVEDLESISPATSEEFVEDISTQPVTPSTSIGSHITTPFDGVP